MFRYGAVALGLVCLLLPRPAVSDPRPVRFGVTLAEPSSSAEDFAPLAAELGNRIGRRVDLVAVTGRGEISRMLDEGEVDFAVLFPYAFAESYAREPREIELLACSLRQGKPSYRGYLVTGRDTSIRSLADLRGTRVAFVHPRSTSGYLYPLQVLQREGLIESAAGLSDFFSEVTYLGSHVAVARAVAVGEVDAGAVLDEGIGLAARSGVDVGAVRILARTEPIPHESLVASTRVDAATRAAFRKALLSIDTRTAAGRKVLAPLATLHLNGFVGCGAEQFDPVRALLPKSPAPGAATP